ncbi:Cullin binding-domain-containing protein [Blyttiomyces helicus]|uniref:Defective in cullin neddylation protein n=1 Tax=Blyttiomyces helicus TaxID=388810 RepID=A0A4P9WKC7_9FUNG|nr:Cullin binding-domain-containing protein [Blyttiomyces helicus]|eukprot:RKO93421.1 Cullin binding-domain-containing protein [Blyttiomyces helicus]
MNPHLPRPDPSRSKRLLPALTVRNSCSSLSSTRGRKIPEPEEEGFSLVRCGRWFESYCDPDDGENADIGIDGLEKMCTDLKISLEGVSGAGVGEGWDRKRRYRRTDELAAAPFIEILALCQKLNAQKMGRLSKTEWLNGMTSLHQFSTIFDRPTEYRDLYEYAFAFTRSDDSQKSIVVESAQAMWTIVTPPSRFPHVSSFFEFLEERKPVKVINKDQWKNFIEFVTTVDEGLVGYDDSSAWPTLFDEYVEWKREKLEESQQ